MKFKESKYYNKEFLGKKFYKSIDNDEKILTVKEFFNINNKENKYIKQRKNKIIDSFHYELDVYSDHYELNCLNYYVFLHLIFDKPVHITGKHCMQIIAPEIVVKSSENKVLAYCIANKVTIDNNYKNYYEIDASKINNLYFHNQKVRFLSSKVENFYIFNKDLYFHQTSIFLDSHKIKCLGRCNDLKTVTLEYKHFQNGIIHIE